MIQLLANAKRRREALDALNHFAAWDGRWSSPLSSDIVQTLTEAGAPSHCRIISDNPALDGRELPLAEAVAAAEKFAFASILCCLPGQLACYFDEWEARRTRLLLRRLPK